MLGEPGLVEAQPLGELNLLEQFLETLGLRHPGSRLVVTESPKTYAPFLTQDLTVTQWITLRQRLTPSGVGGNQVLAEAALGRRGQPGLDLLKVALEVGRLPMRL